MRPIAAHRYTRQAGRRQPANFSRVDNAFVLSSIASSKGSSEMPTAADFRKYLQTLQASLSTGDATEHTHRPALKALLEADGAVTAINEPKHIDCGAPDFVVRKAGDNPLAIGYIETKDVGISLDPIEKDSNLATPKTQNGRQLKRYRAALPNLILTNYTEFRWYVDGDRRSPANLADDNLKYTKTSIDDTGLLLNDFLQRSPESIGDSATLAQRMARLTHLIRDVVRQSFEQGAASPDVNDLYQASMQALVPDLSTDDFADMFAQTLAYGLFAARMNHHGTDFRRQTAAYDIPATNPFIRQIFDIITGPNLDNEPFVSFVDDLTELLRNADMDAVLADFGKRTVGQDPIMHFYETFLAAYDPDLRQSRGVYYTPEPVVGYIVRSVDHLLREKFGCTEGLADFSETQYEAFDSAGNAKQNTSHRVLILDPACGTGSFLYAAIDHIREHYRKANLGGMWSGYVKDHLLPRLFGFELLMAPYAMAHLKLGMQLAAQDMSEDERADWAYEFGNNERLGVYLTNSLEQAEQQTPTMFGPLRVITDEANAAAEIKRDLPIMVVLGNPPYSGHSANKGEWITDLINTYKEGFPELKKPAQAKWLSDDYVKFIRFAQWRIDRSGSGILAFITNHSYLDNPTFRGMRHSLMDTFDDIYLLNLHGNANKKESSPDGSVDQNVFDIRQGVAIALFVKTPNGDNGPARVFHSDLWGARENDSDGGKYGWLAGNSLETTEWAELTPRDPLYLFIPRDEDLLDEYEKGWRIPEIFSPNGDPAPGIVTTHDQFAISWDAMEASSKVERFLATSSEAEARSHWKLCSQNQWRYDRAKDELAKISWRDQIQPILYRPFDVRTTVFNSNVAVHRRERVMRHMLSGNNLGLITTRQTKDSWSCSATLCISGHKSCAAYDINYLFPLYTYPTEQQIAAGLYPPGHREPNLSPDFTAALERLLGLRFITDGAGDLQDTFGPKDVFQYIYAVFHSPTYRERYDQFLRADFPRVPAPRNVAQFRSLAELGRELTDAHLLRAPALSNAPVGFPVSGGDTIARGYPKYTPPNAAGGVEQGRVYISRSQYFEGVAPEVWQFRTGGYQPVDKWLKDRRGRTLSFDDLQHYRKMVAAIGETIDLMERVDRAIDDTGGLFGAGTEPALNDESIPYAEQQRRAHEIYDVKIRPLLAPADEDKYVMIDILTGDYEIGENRAVLIQALRERRPDAVMHCIHRHQSYGERILSPRAVRKQMGMP